MVFEGEFVVVGEGTYVDADTAVVAAFVAACAAFIASSLAPDAFNCSNCW